MYLARFVAGDASFLSAALTWPAPSDSLVPSSWQRILLAAAAPADVDLALRIAPAATGIQLTLLLTAEEKSEATLRAHSAALLRASPPAGVAVPATAVEFDAVTAALPPRHLRVNHDGYHHHQHPLACDFRLYPSFAAESGAERLAYQIHLGAHRPSAELERRARKYLAWLELEEPFSSAVRGMQATLLQRLRQRGWQACEFLVGPEADLERFMDNLRAHFAETTGRIGFADVPLESGDFTDWLATGCHPARTSSASSSLPALAATIFGPEETAWILSDRPGRQPSAPGILAVPDVFISYASGDFSQAAAICAHLESAGHHCWIAPRDINRSALPYPEAIQLGLAQVRAMVVLLSDTANHSVHIPRELDLALERRLHIIPIRLQNVAPQGQLNYLLRTCQWLNAYQRDFQDTMSELLCRLDPRGTSARP